MPDSMSQAQRQRRANWVALRTLRQLPKAAGQTKDGDAVFEVRSVRLVLRADAGHFNRLVHCSKCRREVVGSAVLTADDLDRSGSPIICQVCVKGSGLAVPWSPEERRSAPAPEVEVHPAPVEVLPVAGDRIEQLESQLEAVVSRLAEVVEDVERRPTPETIEAAVEEGLAEARTKLASSAEAMAVRLAAMDDQVREALRSLATLVDTQRAEVTAVAGAVAETQRGIERLTGASRDLAKAQEQLDRRLTEIAARPTTNAPEVAAREALERRLDELQTELTGLVEAHRARFGEALERGLVEARVDATSREQQVQHGMSRLSAMVAELRNELQASIEAARGPDLAPVVQAQKELAEAQGDLDRRLEALALSMHTGEGRLRDLEQRVQEAFRHLIARLDRGTDSAPAAGTPTGSLLETLDAQLRAAEGRLAERAGVQQVELLIGPESERGDRRPAEAGIDDQGWLFDQDESGIPASSIEPAPRKGNGHLASPS